MLAGPSTKTQGTPEGVADASSTEGFVVGSHETVVTPTPSGAMNALATVGSPGPVSQPWVWARAAEEAVTDATNMVWIARESTRLATDATGRAQVFEGRPEAHDGHIAAREAHLAAATEHRKAADACFNHDRNSDLGRVHDKVKAMHEKAAAAHDAKTSALYHHDEMAEQLKILSENLSGDATSALHVARVRACEHEGRAETARLHSERAAIGAKTACLVVRGELVGVTPAKAFEAAGHAHIKASASHGLAERATAPHLKGPSGGVHQALALRHSSAAMQYLCKAGLEPHQPGEGVCIQGTDYTLGEDMVWARA